MPETVTPGVLTVGIFDSSFRHFDESVTHGQTLPATFRYIDSCDDPAVVDVALATHTDAAVLADSKHPRRVWWMQECAELVDWNRYASHQFPFYDLIVTSRDDLVRAMPERHRWLSLIGTWITDFTPQPKTRDVSMIASAKEFLSGHRVRHAVKAAISDGYDGYGALFDRPIPTKDEALAPYRFSIVIESAGYETWVTEKLCDCFATKTVPLYYGPRNLSRLIDLGFRTGGIIAWHTIEGLRDYLELIHSHPEEWYADRLRTVDINYARIQELRSTEVLLERVLRKYFDLS